VKGLLGVGNALRFNGNDYISIPDEKSLRQQKLTVEDGRSETARPASSSTSYVDDGKKWWRSPQGSQKVWDGQWHHIAGTYDGKTVRVFVDGAEVGTGTPFKGKIKYESPIGEGAIGAYRGSCKLS